MGGFIGLLRRPHRNCDIHSPGTPRSVKDIYVTWKAQVSTTNVGEAWS